MRRVLLVVVGAGLFAAGVGCSSDPSIPASLEGAEFTYQPSDEAARRVATFDELQELVPFEVAGPTRPGGVSIVHVWVFSRPASVDEEARERVTRVAMSGLVDGGAFHLEASIAGVDSGGELLRAVSIGSGDGELYRDGESMALTWRSCGVGYLVGYLGDEVTEEGAVAIANSIDEGCR
jgi:hypothetical protein